ncbi:tetratricopeptide repeat protein [bacterium]|nr:tetratricopeptide repeat protein [bacterium]
MTRAIQLSPGTGAMWFNRGLMRDRSGDHAGAVSDMKRFLELAPDDPNAPMVRRQLQGGE